MNKSFYSRYKNVPKQCLLLQNFRHGEATISQTAQQTLTERQLSETEPYRTDSSLRLMAYDALIKFHSKGIFQNVDPNFTLSPDEYFQAIRDIMDKAFGEGKHCYACILQSEGRCKGVVFNNEGEPLAVLPVPDKSVEIEEYPQIIE